MRYLNFTLASPRNGIEIVALGVNWDLHNFAEFVGLRLAPEAAAVLTWVVPDVTNAWGDSKNHYRGFELWFRKVQRVDITCKRTTIPLSENRTLAEICEINQDGSRHEETSSGTGMPFCLLLKFNGGLSLKVEADEAELRPLDNSSRS